MKHNIFARVRVDDGYSDQTIREAPAVLPLGADWKPIGCVMSRDGLHVWMLLHMRGVCVCVDMMR